MGCSTVALGGNNPLYEPSPDWISPLDVDAFDEDDSNAMVVNERQIRIERGLLWEYTDQVFRIDSPDDLTRVGTQNATWQPDKGDLIVHEISIARDGEAIDLIAQGERMEVLRRERRLESQVLDGSLTATLSIPGLQVGDQLRIRRSITRSDQALGDEVQSYSFLWREPREDADYSRVAVSWPDSLDVRYQAGPDFDIGLAELRNGYNWLEVELPLPEAEDYPNDAPQRYLRSTGLRVGTFSGWEEVSSVMAPFYENDLSLDGLDDLIARIDGIGATYSTDLERAVAALELVQEEVRYLLNGLDGGNYIPQDVTTTWERKYGDCKAKTVLLLAILRRLGIEAEPVLVSTTNGNSVPDLLPLPSAFDHVLVRATIGGELYYLDGTTSGANIAIVGNVPPFEYALPIRSTGAELQPIVQKLPRVSEFTMGLEIDFSAGADIAALTKLRMDLIGASAVQITAMADQLDDERKRQLAKSMGSDMQLVDIDIIKGDDNSEVSMVMTGVVNMDSEYDEETIDIDPGFMVGETEFSPNRSRRQWREIPVSLGQPSASQANILFRFPEPIEGEYRLVGEAELDKEAAGRRFVRSAELNGTVLRIFEKAIISGGEIPADQVIEERRKMAQVTRSDLKLHMPEDLPRRFRFAGGADRTELAPLESAFAAIIAKDPEEPNFHANRAAFRYRTYDLEGALADFDAAIELDGRATFFGQRATVQTELLNPEAALADLEEAYALNPTPWRAINLAEAMADRGMIEEARVLLELEDGDEQARQNLIAALADLDGRTGKFEVGLNRIAEQLEDDPKDADLLNDKCWFMGTWNFRVSGAIDICTRAVENGGNAGYILDSRAMIYFRNGMWDEALIDLEEALDRNPAITTSLLLRGLVRLEKGEEEGHDDIRSALARQPSLAQRFALWGITIPADDE
jgi:tetratricopeptide (TPR) repeat protein